MPEKAPRPVRLELCARETAHGGRPTPQGQARSATLLALSGGRGGAGGRRDSKRCDHRTQRYGKYLLCYITIATLNLYIDIMINTTHRS